MASITKRVSTRVVVDKKTGTEKTVTTERHRARYRDEAGIEHAAHFLKKVDAQRWLDEATAGIVRGDWVDPAAGKITFAQWWSQWAAAQDWAAGTATSADQVLASIGFADVPIRSVTENHVRQWMKAQRLPGPKRKAEDRTRNAAAGLMSAVFAEKTENSADSVRTLGIR